LKVDPAGGGSEAHMIEQAKHLMVQSGAGWVMWLLIALSVITVTIALDRLRAFWGERDDGDRLLPDLDGLLGRAEIEPARERLADSPTVAARVVLAGLARWPQGSRAAQAAMTAAAGVERARLQRRLSFLATVGNNAPFVGLLGTVIGVVGAFDALAAPQAGAATGALAPERVMATIAEALVVTAIGLVVAIPAVALYNHFQSRLAAALASAETLGQVLLSHLPRPGEED
jgi:biopolymer transport protein ExbB